jgi:hypothetical protein
MEVCFLASGERVALLDAADYDGKNAKAVKIQTKTLSGRPCWRDSR